jgi:mannitol/fructose-specific phosphotransferase system IIA component (Ntr-type)
MREMSRSKLDGPAKRKVLSLATALDEDNTELINQRWSGLCRILGHRPNAEQVRQLLTEEQAARLTRMTSFEG